MVMENTLENPVVKQISVILKREPLIELMYEKTKISKYSDSKHNCLVKSKRNKKLGFKELNVNGKGQRKKTDGKEAIYNVAHKECKVVLERLYPHKIEKAKEISQEKNNVPDKNTFTKLNIEKGLKHIPNRTPVYQQITKDNLEKNNDLYEFDELDPFEDTSKAQKRLQKRKCKFKHLSRVKKKKPKKNKTCMTYDKTVQEILQKVLQKVNKLDVQTSTPIRQESHFECNVTGPLQEDNISHMGDDHTAEYVHNVDVNENTLENDEENYSPKNNTNVFRSLYIPLQQNKRIQIISDILLDKTYDDSTFLDEHLEPNANSTVILSEKCYPWRYNENVKRNPHYLNIKKTALPALQQDMVLDYNQLKKLVENFVKIPARPENLRNRPDPTKQAEDIQYINDKENNPISSLFEDDFVPEVQPKLITDYFSKNKQKRTILGPIVQNSNNMKTTHMLRSNTIEADTLIEEVLKPTKDINVYLKSPKTVVDQPRDKNLEPRLFEDDDPSLNFNEISKIYVPKTRKKKKILHNVEDSHQDKPKREMSKSEEAELEKWAATFNSLCEDIENYPLEID